MAFVPQRTGGGTASQELISVIIGNSIVLSVGDCVRISTSGATQGFLTNGAAAVANLGIVVGFTTSSGVPTTPAAYAAGTATSSDVQTYTAASNNQTVAMAKAIVNVSLKETYSVTVQGTMGTTNSSPTSTSNTIGGFIDVDSADTNYGKVLESEYVTTWGDEGFAVLGVDPANPTTNYLVRLFNSQLK